MSTTLELTVRKYPALAPFLRAVAHLDYDDTTLDFVRFEADRLLWMFSCLDGAEIWMSSFGKHGRNSYHIKFYPAVPISVMEEVVAHSHCHLDYRTYVLERHECTLRLGRGILGQPVPFKIEDVWRNESVRQNRTQNP